MDNEAQAETVKMSGYLYLKTKKRIISTWKNYWFVLKDRLLLYYRSKAEYEALSPCKGSINLGPPCAIKSLPSVNNAFQIETTRSISHTLKADNTDDQKKWMQVILSVLNQNQNFNADCAKRLSHFRYSLDNLIPEVEASDNQMARGPFERQNTMPHRTSSQSKDNNEIIQRLQRMGAQSYGGSLHAIQVVTKKAASPALDDPTEDRGNEARFTFEEDFIRSKEFSSENIYERMSDISDNSVLLGCDGEGDYSVPLRKSANSLDQANSEMARNPALQGRETKSLMIENDQYGFRRHVHSDEVIYSEPKVQECMDYNKNSVSIENSFYASADVIHEASSQSENLYEDLDGNGYYSKPLFKVKESSSHSSVDSDKIVKSSDSPINNEKKLRKTKSFIKRVWRKKKEKRSELEPNKEAEEDLYAEIDATTVEKVCITNDGAFQMLTELQNILESKKTKLRGTQSLNSDTDQSEPINDAEPGDSESKCPVLPPKTHKVSQNKVRQSLEQVRSLDEILEELDKEKVETKGKVQLLIEKFSESDCDVVLRKSDKSETRTYTYSGDLNELLDELAKVTSAPVMKPGVTSSLIDPDLTNEEWLKLLPIRHRRLSEPDYDVPRIHKSLQIPSKDSKGAYTIKGTRFFGPVLPSTPVESKDDSLTISMTPDSLEVEVPQKHENQYSYTSHNYNEADLKEFPQQNEIVYALPKTYFSVATHIVNTCQNIGGAPLSEECTVVYKSVRNIEMQEEVFSDSLELWSEGSVQF